MSARPPLHASLAFARRALHSRLLAEAARLEASASRQPGPGAGERPERICTGIGGLKMAHPYSTYSPGYHPNDIPVGRIALAGDMPVAHVIVIPPSRSNRELSMEIEQQFLQIEEDSRKAQLAAAERRGALAERERIRLLALAGLDWLEPADFVQPRPSSPDGDLWARAQAVALADFAKRLAAEGQP